MAKVTFVQDRTRLRRQIVGMIATLLALALQASPLVCPSDDALRAKDQALLDAIAPGNRKLWDATLTGDAVYVDENGAILPRQKFLDSLTPLGPNISGSLVIVSYQVTHEGDTALVIHKDDERENYHGIWLRAGYLTTETWLCRAGEWKLAMIHTYAEAKDPPAVPLAADKLTQYVGTYRAAPDLIWNIHLDGDHLVAGREGKPAHPLLMEAPDIFFVPGQPREKQIFQRDSEGRVTSVIWRREGEDIVWKRMD
jgi:hypothetical protein